LCRAGRAMTAAGPRPVWFAGMASQLPSRPARPLTSDESKRDARQSLAAAEQ